MKYLVLALFITIHIESFGQAKVKVEFEGVVINDTNGEIPDPSSVLDVSSSSKGVLFPRLTTAERDLIQDPAEGLLIYNSSKKVYEFFNGSSWLTMGVVSPDLSSYALHIEPSSDIGGRGQDIEMNGNDIDIAGDLVSN